LNKIILFLLLVSSVFADAKLYLGVNTGLFDESFNGNTSAYTSSGIATFKIGYAQRETYGIEFSLDYTKSNSNIFSNNDGDRYGLNVNLLKAFDYNIYVLPYFKGGMGAGFFNVDRTMDDKIYYGSFNIGTGIFIPLNDNFDFELGYEYRYTSFESINLISEKLSYTSNIGRAYFGFNVRY